VNSVPQNVSRGVVLVLPNKSLNLRSPLRGVFVENGGVVETVQAGNHRPGTLEFIRRRNSCRFATTEKRIAAYAAFVMGLWLGLRLLQRGGAA
jgi:hypothetical protein